MSDKEAQIEQLRAELAQAQQVANTADWLHDNAMKILRQERVAAQTQSAELTNACAAQDALAAELADARRVALSYLRMATERKKELAQAREELVTADAAMDAVQALWRSPAEAKRQDVNLAQACAKLKDLQGANRALGQDLAAVKDNRDYWYDKTLDAEAGWNEARKEAQAQSDEVQRDEVQRDWLSPEDTKGARRRIDELEAKRDHWLRKHCESERKADGLRRQLKHMKSERNFWLKEHDALAHGCHSETTTELSERLATLDAAEAALEGCGIGGIFAGFDGLPDAINQMAQHIKELTQEPVEIEMTDAEIGEALQTEVRKRVTAETDAHTLSKALDECTQTVHTKRALRQEAELRASQSEQYAENLQRKKDSVHEALDECQIPRTYDDSSRATIRTRIFWLNDRVTRAEALAQLVTPGLAEMLEQMASFLHVSGWCIYEKDTIEAAERLAAQIREALDDSQA